MEILKVLKPNQSPLVETRLIWLRENSPELLLEHWNNGTLQEKVMEDVQDSMSYYSALREQGVPQLEARELRLAVLAPADNLDLVRESKIPDSLFNEIVESVMS